MTDDKRPVERADLQPWAPGVEGKFIIGVDGVLLHWCVDEQGWPDHADVRILLDIESLMEGEIEPSGSCWATARGVSAGPDLVTRAFAAVQDQALTYSGRRSQRKGRTCRRDWGRSPDRIPMVLSATERAWARQPDTRLGQLLVNLLRMNTNIPWEDEGRLLFNIEDGQLLRWLGTETEEEETYIREEPRRAREGWRTWERSFREFRSRSGDRKTEDEEQE